MGMTRAQKMNKIFDRDGAVRIFYKDGSYAIIDDLTSKINAKDGTRATIGSYRYRSVGEVVEDMLSRGDIKQDEKEYYLGHARLVQYCLYDKNDRLYDRQDEILVTDDVTDALFYAPYGLDYAALVTTA